MMEAEKDVLVIIDESTTEQLTGLGKEKLTSIWREFTLELLEFTRIRARAFKSAENLGAYYNEEERNMCRREIKLKEALAKAA